METIVNKVAESGIITLDLANYLPDAAGIVGFDLRPFLFREMILREKDYRAALLSHDWSLYKDKRVAIHCSVDAIIPVWAYMLAVTYLEPIAAGIFFGTETELRDRITLSNIEDIDTEVFRDKRVVIKGCGDVPVPDGAYVAVTAKLTPVVKSVMYGEPCSTVPVFKKKA